jgi:NADH-quinone oxidoreductase subunit M
MTPMAAASLPSWLLPALILWPLVGAGAIRFLGRVAVAGNPNAFSPWREVRRISATVLGIEALLATWLWLALDPSAGWQAVLDLPWIVEWGARITLGVDGVSALMILLTAWLLFLAVVGSWGAVKEKVRTYHALLLVFVSGTIGVFAALDLLLFYVLWEVMLIPLYFMIGMFGGRERVSSSFRFFVLTMAASLFMLVAIGAAWLAAGGTTFSLDALLARLDLSVGQQVWLLLAFVLAFAVKSAVFPFHFWLPDAQHEAPTTASIALGIKVGGYGLYRFALPLFPAAAMDDTVRAVMLTIGTVGIIYGALVAMVQPDFKRLVSYAAISHVGFVIVGLWANTVQGVTGAVMVMVSSGVTNGALFLLLGILHEQRRTGMIANFGGIARVVPVFAAFLTLVSMSSIGLPGTQGFIGEFLVLAGVYREYPLFALLAATGVILAAVYFLWAVERTLFQELRIAENRKLRDLNRRELGVMVLFAVVTLWVGIAPGRVLRTIEPSAERLVERVAQGAARQAAAPRNGLPPAAR